MVLKNNIFLVSLFVFLFSLSAFLAINLISLKNPKVLGDTIGYGVPCSVVDTWQKNYCSAAPISPPIVYPTATPTARPPIHITKIPTPTPRLPTCSDSTRKSCELAIPASDRCSVLNEKQCHWINGTLKTVQCLKYNSQCTACGINIWLITNTLSCDLGGGIPTSAPTPNL
jgi:hypothetical protein